MSGAFMDDAPLYIAAVCVDGANVAHSFARAVTGREGSEPDASGIERAYSFFSLRRHDVCIVLPRAYASRPAFAPAQMRAACPAATLTYAPAGDDLFLLAQARARDAFIVTNDLFRAEVALTARTTGDLDASRLAEFVAQRSISYAFSDRGDFLANPIASGAALHSERAAPDPPPAPVGAFSALAPCIALSRAGAGDDVDMADAPQSSIASSSGPANVKQPLDAAASLVSSRFASEVERVVAESLRGGEPLGSLAGVGDSDVSHPTPSPEALVAVLLRLAARELATKADIKRLTSGGSACLEEAARSLVLWTRERKAVLRDGIAVLRR